MNVVRSSFTSLVTFALMPIYSLPILLINIWKKSYFSVYLFSFFLGICSFVYIPYSNDDRTRHYDRFYEVANIRSVNSLFKYLTDSNLPDSLGYLLMYVVNGFSSDPRFVFLIATTISAFLYTYVYVNLNRSILDKASNKIFFYSFLLFVASLPYLAWFSGLRFGLASSFLFVGWYHLSQRKFALKGFVFLTLAIFTHFGTLLLLLPVFCAIYLKKFNAKRMLIFTLPLIVVPNAVIYNIITMLPLPGTITKKAYDYLMWEDMLVTMSSNAPILKLILIYKTLWVPAILFYLLRRKKEMGFNAVYNFLLYLFIVRNLFSSSPVITGYYDSIILPITMMFLIQDYFKNRLSNRKLIIAVVYFIGFMLIDMYKLRDGFIMSNFSLENISFISIFLKEMPAFIPEPWN